jgi:hypothetical protein
LIVNQIRALRQGRVALGLIVLFVIAWTLAIYVVPVLPFVPRSTADLKYSVIDKIGDPLVCTGWGMPNPTFAPYQEYPHILADVPTYLAILRRERLPTGPLTADQIVTVYREWLKLNAVELQGQGGSYDFKLFPGLGGPSEALRNEMLGNVDSFGHVYNVHQGSGIGACPICLAGNSPISTPTGPLAVSTIRTGMLVWSTATDGRLEDAVVLETISRLDAPGSRLIHLVLADGRELTASPSHRIGDGRALGSLRIGDQVDGNRIANIEVVPDLLGFTYDLLPSGETGEYFVDGILVQSTLSHSAVSAGTDNRS